MIVGINHQSAPVSIREKVAFSGEQLPEALLRLKQSSELDELCILSTCNRTEIYAIDSDANSDDIVRWLCEFHQIDLQSLKSSIYSFRDDDAVSHIMRVAAGLDSMVLGEPQILGQMKEAFSIAVDTGTIGTQLNHLSQNTFRIAKKVRTDTAIGETNVSVASTAVNLATNLFGNLEQCKVLLIGAGETIELVAKHLQQAGISHFVVANRTLSNAERLANEINGSYTDLSRLHDHLGEIDLVFSSTGSQLPILGKGMVERVIKERKHRPIFMVDLAVPRDIEPEISDLPDIYLYTIDDLQLIVSDNMNVREGAASDAQRIVIEAVVDYRQQHQSLKARDLLVEFRERHQLLKNQELEKAVQRLSKGDNPEEVLASFANQLLNKMMHQPSITIKEAAAENHLQTLQAVSRLYDLEFDPEKELKVPEDDAGK